MSDALPRVFGPYVLRRELGAGSGGAVYLARPGPHLTGWPNELVIKLLHAEAAGDPSYVARFEHEAAVAVRVEHRNVVRVLDAGLIDDRYYITMDRVDGRDLASIRNDLADRDTRLPVPIAANIIRQILDGLVALHSITDDRGISIGFVHRDLSPRNIMIAGDGRVRIIDLGLGKSALQEWQTQVGTTLGSAGYMPPEQAAGDSVGQAADIFAIGAVAFELFTGHRMIPIGDVMKMLHATIAYKHRALVEFVPELPATIDTMVANATAHRPDDRFARVDDFRSALLASGVTFARDDEVASYLETMFGPVQPVPLGPDDMDTAFTEGTGNHTVVARRVGLSVVADLMYQPTRAEISPFADVGTPSSMSASVAAPRRNLRLVAVLLAVMLVATIAIGFSLVNRPPPVVHVVEGPSVSPPIPGAAAPRATARPPRPAVAERPVREKSGRPVRVRAVSQKSQVATTPAPPKQVVPPPSPKTLAVRNPIGGPSPEQRRRIKTMHDRLRQLRADSDLPAALRVRVARLLLSVGKIENVESRSAVETQVSIAERSFDRLEAAIEAAHQQGSAPSAD